MCALKDMQAGWEEKLKWFQVHLLLASVLSLFQRAKDVALLTHENVYSVITFETQHTLQLGESKRWKKGFRTILDCQCCLLKRVPVLKGVKRL